MKRAQVMARLGSLARVVKLPKDATLFELERRYIEVEVPAPKPAPGVRPATRLALAWVATYMCGSRRRELALDHRTGGLIRER